MQGVFPDNTDCTLIPQRPVPVRGEGVLPKLFMVWAEHSTAVEKVVASLESTFVDCPTDVRGGYLRNDNVVKNWKKMN